MPHAPAVSFEGNIGVGKSTLLRAVSQDPRLQGKVSLLPEPIGQWENVSGSGLNLLEAYYKEPQRYAYLFQSYVFLTRFVQHHTGATTAASSLRLTERSVFTDRCVFAALQIQQGLFNEMETAVYQAWFDPVLHALPDLIPDAFVYLRADPQVCHERLKKRARQEEAGVGLDYLELLHHRHEQWFVQGSLAPEAQEHLLTGHGGPYNCCQGTVNGHLPVTHPSIDGKSVLVVNCNPDITFEEPSVERDQLIDSIVIFLLSLWDQQPHPMTPLEPADMVT
eukprot:SM000057S18395  [mRNA]  locus=s57:372360:374487:- [translate_table: standard]